MCKQNYTLFILLMVLAFSCSDELSDTSCPVSTDYGLLSLTEESLAFLPDTYESNEQLLFKNEAGEEIIFYPQHERIRTSTDSRTSTLWCGDEGQSDFSYTSEKVELSYRSTNGYVLHIVFETRHVQGWGNTAALLQFFDLLEVNLYRLEDRRIILEDRCALKIPVSYRGGTETDLENLWVQYNYIAEVELNGIRYTDVYTTGCGSIPEITYQKGGGLLSFTDVEGQRWIFDRIQKFEEEVAPELILPDTSGQLVRLSEVEGELILIDFWASWCGPCRDENEEILKPLYTAYKEKGLEIFSVSVDTDRAAWIQAIEEDEVQWYQVSDLEGYNSEVFTHYEIYGIPTIYVIDQNRNILSKNMRGEELEPFVQLYLE